MKTQDSMRTVKRDPRPYVGYKECGTIEFFMSEFTPTRETHGSVYVAVTGPFDTIAGAKWAERYGRHNPHFTCVHDAEIQAESFLHAKMVKGK